MDETRRMLQAENEKLKKRIADLESELSVEGLRKEALRFSSADYRAILDSLGVGILLGNSDGSRFLFGNRTMCRMLGYSIEELCELGIADIHPRSSYDWVINEFRRLLSDQIITSELIPVKRKDGTVFHADLMGSKIMIGQKLLVAAIFQDSYSRKSSDESLQLVKDRYRNIVNVSPMGIHMYKLKKDDRLIFTGANPAADRLLGMDNTQFIGLDLEEAFPGLKGSDIGERYRSVALTGKPWEIDRFEYEDENIKSVFKVCAFQSSPMHVAVFFLDIAKFLEDQL